MNRTNVGRNKVVYNVTSRDSTQLIFLRARWYNPADGRFQSRDTWGGDSNLPMSYNRWQYTYSNPINRIDPTGFNPNCIEAYRGNYPGGGFCAYQRFMEILAENSGNGVNALINLFTDSELQNVWGRRGAGSTSATRLEWILKVTLGSAPSLGLDAGAKLSSVIPPLTIHLQFGILFCGESGLPDELEDSQFYDGNTWKKKPSYQINHFLSAVGEYYDGRDVRLVIAHEKSRDPNGMTDWDGLYHNFFGEVTSNDYHHFYKAWHYDTNGMYTERDKELWAILRFNEDIALGGVDKKREGNSLQDFRLSLRGVRFADWVIYHMPPATPAEMENGWRPFYLYLKRTP